MSWQRSQVSQRSARPKSTIDFGSWPIAEVAQCPLSRRYRRYSGQHRFVMNISACDPRDISILADPSHGERDTDAKIASAAGGPSDKSGSLQSVDRDGTKEFNQ
jgi:hypothetical protein